MTSSRALVRIISFWRKSSNYNHVRRSSETRRRRGRQAKKKNKKNKKKKRIAHRRVERGGVMTGVAGAADRMKRYTRRSGEISF